MYLKKKEQKELQFLITIFPQLYKTDFIISAFMNNIDKDSSIFPLFP